MPNGIDVGILLVVAWNVADGVRRGFVGAIVALAGFLLTVMIALVSYVQVADWAAEQFGLPVLLAQPLAFGGLWLITGFLVGVVGQFVAAPFGFLFRGSPLGMLLSVAPSALKGFAVAGFALMLILAPAPLPIGLPAALMSQLREAVQDSELAEPLVERTGGFERWARGMLEGPVSQTLTLLTVRPEATERLDLKFQLLAPAIDEAAEVRMLELINRERLEVGLNPLVRDGALEAVARGHSTDMVQRGYFGHESPEGASHYDRMLEGGVRFRLAGENLALAPTVEIAHRGLMESSGHRANILSPEFGRVGIGVVRVNGIGRLFTQDFAN